MDNELNIAIYDLGEIFDDLSDTQKRTLQGIVNSTTTEINDIIHVFLTTKNINTTLFFEYIKSLKNNSCKEKSNIDQTYTHEKDSTQQNIEIDQRNFVPINNQRNFVPIIGELPLRKRKHESEKIIYNVPIIVEPIKKRKHEPEIIIHNKDIKLEKIKSDCDKQNYRRRSIRISNMQKKTYRETNHCKNTDTNSRSIEGTNSVVGFTHILKEIFAADNSLPDYRELVDISKKTGISIKRIRLWFYDARYCAKKKTHNLQNTRKLKRKKHF